MTGSSRCLGRALAECPAEYFPDEQSVKSIRNSKMNNSMKAMQVVRGICQSLCIVLLLLSCGALSAQNQEHRVRNIVLANGAWADGSGWKGVYDILVKDGHNVSVAQEPKASVKEDVAATKRTLLQDGRCILVAHSYGDEPGHTSADMRLRTPDALLRVCQSFGSNCDDFPQADFPPTNLVIVGLDYFRIAD